jgi:hypothetical protein
MAEGKHVSSDELSFVYHKIRFVLTLLEHKTQGVTLFRIMSPISREDHCLYILIHNAESSYIVFILIRTSGAKFVFATVRNFTSERDRICVRIDDVFL